MSEVVRKTRDGYLSGVNAGLCTEVQLLWVKEDPVLCASQPNLLRIATK